MHEIELVCVDAIKPNPRNAHTHSKKQIRQIADSIVAYGFTVPVLIDETQRCLPGTVASRRQNFSVSRKSPSSD